jgi:hypothetical protein
MVTTAGTKENSGSEFSSTTSTNEPEELEPIYNYEALVYDYTDGTGTNGIKEFDTSRFGGYGKKNNPPSATLNWNGKEYIGKYERTLYAPLKNYIPIDFYTYRQEGVDYSIDYGMEGDELVYFSLYWEVDRSDYYKGKEKCSEEECVNIAKEYIKKLVPNSDDYIVKDIGFMKFSVGDELRYSSSYVIDFIEVVDGKRIGNVVSVSVNIYGEVMHYYVSGCMDANEVKKDGILERQNWDAVEEAIEERVYEAYANCKEKVEYLNCIYVLDQFEDGSYFLQIQAFVNIGTKQPWEDSILMVMFIE